MIVRLLLAVSEVLPTTLDGVDALCLSWTGRMEERKTYCD